MWGPNTVLLACMPCGGCVPRGWWGAVPGGGWPATVVRGVWCQALSLPRPPVLWGGQPGVPRLVCSGCSRCGRGDPAPVPQRAPLRASVARCGGGGRASPGGVPSAVVRGVWVKAPPLPCCPPSGRVAGARWPRAVGAGVDVCGVCGVCAVRVVVRGAAFILSLWCSPLRCFGAVWSPPCAVCLPCSLPCARPLLGCWLPLVSFVASLLFTLSSARLSPWHALFFSLCPGVCRCLFLRRLSLSLRPVRQKEGWVYVGLRRLGAVVVHRWHHFRCGVAAYNIPAFAPHLCLRVCARSSPFAPYHGVLMSLSPYLLVCCLSWCRCTPYAKREVCGWGPYFLFLPLLPGWSHTFVGLGWWRGRDAR